MNMNTSPDKVQESPLLSKIAKLKNAIDETEAYGVDATKLRDELAALETQTTEVKAPETPELSVMGQVHEAKKEENPVKLAEAEAAADAHFLVKKPETPADALDAVNPEPLHDAHVGRFEENNDKKMTALKASHKELSALIDGKDYIKDKNSEGGPIIFSQQEYSSKQREIEPLVAGLEKDINKLHYHIDGSISNSFLTSVSETAKDYRGNGQPASGDVEKVIDGLVSVGLVDKFDDIDQSDISSMRRYEKMSDGVAVGISNAFKNYKGNPSLVDLQHELKRSISFVLKERFTGLSGGVDGFNENTNDAIKNKLYSDFLKKSGILNKDFLFRSITSKEGPVEVISLDEFLKVNGD